MYSDDIMGMIGREVEVEAEGMLYKGRLIEVSDTDVFLQGLMGWLQIPVQKVKTIKLAV